MAIEALKYLACHFAFMNLLIKQCCHLVVFCFDIVLPQNFSSCIYLILSILIHCSISRTCDGKATRARVAMMPIGTPRVPYRNPTEGTWQWVDIWNALVSLKGYYSYKRVY